MRKSKVLAKLHNNQFARICGLGHYLPFFIKYAAQYKYDGIWLDIEHRAMTDREVQALLAFCHLNDIDCMVRPPTLQRTRLYRYLEDGAAGFMFPFISNADAARYVVNCVKFPPMGNRGIDGAGLDGDFGVTVWHPGSTYFEDANNETFIVAQIETVEALANLDEIASVPGIDLLFVGPADLGRRLSVAEGPNKMSLDEAVIKVAEVAKKHGKAWGRTAGSIADVERFRAMGAQMVPWGGDFALMNVLKQASEEMDKANL
ncbi:MAG: 4-hydroxy-2-oxovalerate aldolase [Chloroflexi bacterium]|nr:4-hydroxy-2-oxovalerate aldolase [Chloroflexota bacterium]